MAGARVYLIRAGKDGFTDNSQLGSTSTVIDTANEPPPPLLHTLHLHSSIHSTSTPPYTHACASLIPAARRLQSSPSDSVSDTEEPRAIFSPERITEAVKVGRE